MSRFAPTSRRRLCRALPLLAATATAFLAVPLPFAHAAPPRPQAHHARPHKPVSIAAQSSPAPPAWPVPVASV